jgi:membrane protein implicated in regulation of membrane protease activity
MTSKNKGSDIIASIGYIILYALLLPFVLAFTIIAAVGGSVFLVLYTVCALIAWPFIEIHAARVEKRNEKNITVPEKIDASVGMIEVSDNEERS